MGDIRYEPRMEIDKNEDLKQRYAFNSRPTPEYLEEHGGEHVVATKKALQAARAKPGNLEGISKDENVQD